MDGAAVDEAGQTAKPHLSKLSATVSPEIDPAMGADTDPTASTRSSTMQRQTAPTASETDTQAAQTASSEQSVDANAAKTGDNKVPATARSPAIAASAEADQTPTSESRINAAEETTEKQSSEAGEKQTAGTVTPAAEKRVEVPASDPKEQAAVDPRDVPAAASVVAAADIVEAVPYSDEPAQATRSKDYRERHHADAGTAGSRMHAFTGRLFPAARRSAFPAPCNTGAVAEAGEQLSETGQLAGTREVEQGGEPTGPRHLANQDSRPVMVTERSLDQQPTTSQGRVENSRDLSHADQTRLIQRVARALQAAPQRGGTLRLRLRPPQLGSLRLEVTVEKGGLTARLEAETQTARNLLLDHLPQLRDRLMEQGIRIEQFHVDVSQQDTGQSQQRAGHAQHQSQTEEPGSERPRQDDLADDQNASAEITNIIGQRELDVVV